MTWIVISIVVGVILTVLGGYTNLYDLMVPKKFHKGESGSPVWLSVCLNLFIFYIFVGLMPDVIMVITGGKFGLYSLISLVGWTYLVILMMIVGEIVNLNKN